MEDNDNDLLPPAGHVYWSKDRNDPAHKAAVAEVVARFAARHDRGGASAGVGAPAAVGLNADLDDDSSDGTPLRHHGESIHRHRSGRFAVPGAGGGPPAVEPDLTPPYDPKAHFWNKNHPAHDDAVRAVRQAHVAEYGAAFQDLDDLPHVTQLRSLANVSAPTIPAPCADHYDSEAEGQVLAYGINEGIAGDVMSAARDFYVWAVTGNGGALPADAETRFREEFTDRLRPEQIDKLVAYVRRYHELNGGGA